MAKNPRDKNRVGPPDPTIDFDDGLMDFDETGFGEADATPRKPIESVKSGVLKGAADLSSDTQFLRGLFRGAMPEEYENTIDSAYSLYDAGSDLYDTHEHEAKRVAGQLRKLAQKTVPGARRYIPDAVANRINKWIGETEEEQDQRRRDWEEESISRDLARIFTIQAEENAKKTEEERAEDAVRQTIDEKRFTRQTEIQRETMRMTQRLVGYQDGILYNYQRKSLEIQLRTLGVLRKMHDVSVQTGKSTQIRLDTIAKNTALPDFQKQLMSETVRSHLRNRAISSIVGGPAAKMKRTFSEFFGNLSSNISKSIREGLASISESARAAEGAADMVTAFGGDTRDTMMEMGAQELTRGVGGRIAPWLGSLLRPYVASAGGKRLRAGGSWLNRIFGDAGSTANTIRRRTVATPLDLNADTSGRDVLNATKSGIREMLLGSLPSTGGEERRIMGRTSRHLNEPGLMTNRFTRSIEETIPRILTMIYGEVRATRTGEPVEDLTYDFDRRQFVTKASVSEEFRKKIFNPYRRKNIEAGIAETADTIVGDSKLSPSARKALEDRILRDSREGVHFRPEDYVSDRHWGDSSAKAVEEIRQLVKARFDVGEDGKWKSTSESQILYGDIVDRHRKLADGMPDVQGDFIQALRDGNMTVLEEMGLVEFKNGEWFVDHDEFYRQLMGASATPKGSSASRKPTPRRPTPRASTAAPKVPLSTLINDAEAEPKGPADQSMRNRFARYADRISKMGVFDPQKGDGGTTGGTWSSLMARARDSLSSLRGTPDVGAGTAANAVADTPEVAAQKETTFAVNRLYSVLAGVHGAPELTAGEMSGKATSETLFQRAGKWFKDRKHLLDKEHREKLRKGITSWASADGDNIRDGSWRDQLRKATGVGGKAVDKVAGTAAKFGLKGTPLWIMSSAIFSIAKFLGKSLLFSPFRGLGALFSVGKYLPTMARGLATLASVGIPALGKGIGQLLKVGIPSVLRGWKTSAVWLGKTMAGLTKAIGILGVGIGKGVAKLSWNIAKAAGRGLLRAPGALARGAGWLARGLVMKAIPAVAGALLSPVGLVVMGVAALAFGGYKLYQYMQNRHNFLVKVRMMQYGVNPGKKTHVNKIDKLEQALLPYVKLPPKDDKLGRAEIRANLDPKTLLAIYDIDPEDTEAVDRWGQWFGEKFKPIFLKHCLVMRDVAAEYNQPVAITDLTRVDEVFKNLRLKSEFLTRVQIMPEDGGINPLDSVLTPTTSIDIKYHGESVRRRVKTIAEEVARLAEDEKPIDTDGEFDDDNFTMTAQEKLTEEKRKELQARMAEATANYQRAQEADRARREAQGAAYRQAETDLLNKGVINLNTDPAPTTNERADGWMWPVKGGRISSTWGPRVHPIHGTVGSMHKGIDIAAPEGTPVYAAFDGWVIRREYSTSYGNVIYLRHENGYATRYAHMHQFAPGIKVGDFVKAGQLIGFVGNTGQSAGNHLHFEIRKTTAWDAETIDPVRYVGQSDATAQAAADALKEDQENARRAATGADRDFKDDENDPAEGLNTIAATEVPMSVDAKPYEHKPLGMTSAYSAVLNGLDESQVGLSRFNGIKQSAEFGDVGGPAMPAGSGVMAPPSVTASLNEEKQRLDAAAAAERNAKTQEELLRAQRDGTAEQTNVAKSSLSTLEELREHMAKMVSLQEAANAALGAQAPKADNASQAPPNRPGMSQDTGFPAPSIRMR